MSTNYIAHFLRNLRQKNWVNLFTFAKVMKKQCHFCLTRSVYEFHNITCNNVT